MYYVRLVLWFSWRGDVLYHAVTGNKDSLPTLRAIDDDLRRAVRAWSAASDEEVLSASFDWGCSDLGIIDTRETEWSIYGSELSQLTVSTAIALLDGGAIHIGRRTHL